MNKVLKNQYVYSIVTKFVTIGIGFLNSVVLARYLGSELKGMAATAANSAQIISIIITFGLQEAYPFFRKKDKSKDFLSKYMTMVVAIFVTYAIIATVGIILFQPTAEVIACIVIAIVEGYSMVVNYVALVESPNRRNTAMMVMYLIDFIILVILYFFVPKSFLIAVFLTAYIYFAQSIFYTIDSKFKLKISLLNKKDFVEYLKFGFLPMIALLLTTLNYRIDIVMLRATPSVTYAEIGLYSVGVGLAEKVFLIPNSVKEILLSKLANGTSSKEVCKTIRICYPICLMATVGLILLGQPFINIFYGDEYSGAYLTTVISVLGTVFMIFFKMISTYNIVNGKQKVNLILLAVAVVVNVVLNFILIPKMGTNGAALASDISYFLCAVLFIIYFINLEDIKLSEMLFVQKEDIKLLKKLWRK